MKKLLFVVLTLFAIQPVFADTEVDFSNSNVESQGEALYVAPQCPKISSDYAEALTTLRSMKNSILKEAGCETASEATTHLENLVLPGRSGALEIVKKNNGKMLSASDATKIENYANQVTLAVTDIFSLMGGSDCPVHEEKKSLMYKSLINIAFDALSSLGNVVGPYGAPLSVGFSALKGVLGGIYEYNENNSGYKFDVSETGRDEAKLYIQSLCAFYEFNLQAEKLLEASDRKNSYLNLENHLNNKIAFLTGQGVCNGCQDLANIVDDYQSTSPQALQLVKDINSANSEDLGTHLLDALQTKLWLEDQKNKLDIEEFEYNESVGPALLGKELEQLEEFLVYKEAEDFMHWIYDETRSSYKDYQSDVRDWVSSSYFDLEFFQKMTGRYRRSVEIAIPYTTVKKQKDFVSIYDYKEYLVNNTDKLPDYSWYKDAMLVEAEYNKSVKVLKNVNRFISSHNEYCSFFKNAGYYDAIHLKCNDPDMQAMNEAFLRQALPDPKLTNYLEQSKRERERLLSITGYTEEWSLHLPELFNQWNKIQDEQIKKLILK